MRLNNLLKYGTALSLSCMLMLTALSTAYAQAPANGTNVKWLEYTGPQGGSVIGKFFQSAAGQWTEEAPDGTHSFTELQRDAWSVYLQRSNGARIQLDLHTKNITLNRSQKLYKIASAKTSVPAPSVINGQNVQWVQYSGGRTGTFCVTGPKQWSEENSDGRHTFTEQARDEWSVYLRRTDGQLTIQLDLHTKDIVLNGNQKLYRIAKVSANPSGS